MELSVLFMGPVGAGKTVGIRSVSDIGVVDTDMAATDEVVRIKPQTTVAMDMGVMHLSDDDKLRLCGAPGQDRFDFMWDILLMQCRGLVLFLNHAESNALAALDHYLDALETRLGGKKMPMVIGITHVEQNPQVSLDIYRKRLKERPCKFMDIAPPVFGVDARESNQVRGLLAALIGIFEISERLHQKAHRLH